MERISFCVYGLDIECYINRKEMNGFKLTVKPDGRVMVSASYLTSMEEITDYIKENTVWIYGVIYKYKVEAGKIKVDFDFTYKDRKFRYKIVQKDIKNINIRIKSGKILVSAPFLTSDEAVHDAVNRKKDWLYKNVIKHEKNRCNKKIYKTFENGDKLNYLGEEFTLNVTEGDGNIVTIDTDNKMFYIEAEDLNDIELKKEIYESIQKSHAKFYFNKILNEMYDKVEYLGILYPRITARRMKTRWGSCGYNKNRITLNVYLIEHSIELIELVILHELLHFIHPNHSPKFYKLHEKLMPDYKKREEKLNAKIIRII